MNSTDVLDWREGAHGAMPCRGKGRIRVFPYEHSYPRTWATARWRQETADLIGGKRKKAVNRAISREAMRGIIVTWLCAIWSYPSDIRYQTSAQDRGTLSAER